MRPILFRYGRIVVWSYPAMLYLGLVAGVVAGNAAAHAAGINAFRAWVATLILIVPAIAGSRLLFVFSRWGVYRQNLRRIWDPNDGGAGMYGGFVAAVLLSVPLLSKLAIPFWTFWDVSMFTILVGMVFTRVGCFLNGCCAGRPSTAFGSMRLPNQLGVWERRIPTQCLEGAFALLLLILATLSWKWMTFPGELSLLVTAGYAGGRVALESAREQEPGTGNLTMYHAISLIMVLVTLATLAARLL